jgi:hypothetical protein
MHSTRASQRAAGCCCPHSLHFKLRELHLCACMAQDTSSYPRHSRVETYVVVPLCVAYTSIGARRCSGSAFYQVLRSLGNTNYLLLILILIILSTYDSLFTMCDVVGTWSREYQSSSKSSSSPDHSLFFRTNVQIADKFRTYLEQNRIYFCQISDIFRTDFGQISDRFRTKTIPLHF